jgi:hypothetical protein
LRSISLLLDPPTFLFFFFRVCRSFSLLYIPLSFFFFFFFFCVCRSLSLLHIPQSPPFFFPVACPSSLVLPPLAFLCPPIAQSRSPNGSVQIPQWLSPITSSLINPVTTLWSPNSQFIDLSHTLPPQSIL